MPPPADGNQYRLPVPSIGTTEKRRASERATSQLTSISERAREGERVSGCRTGARGCSHLHRRTHWSVFVCARVCVCTCFAGSATPPGRPHPSPPTSASSRVTLMNGTSCRRDPASPLQSEKKKTVTLHQFAQQSSKLATELIHRRRIRAPTSGPEVRFFFGEGKKMLRAWRNCTRRRD